METLSSETIIAKAKEALSVKLSISKEDIKFVSSTSGQWSDSSMGVEESDSCFTMALVPGYIILLEAGDKQYQYNADTQGNMKYSETVGQKGFYV